MSTLCCGCNKKKKANLGVDNSEMILEVQAPDTQMIADQSGSEVSTVKQERDNILTYSPTKPDVGNEDKTKNNQAELSSHSEVTANNLQLDIIELVIKQTSFNHMKTAQTINSGESPALALQSTRSPTSSVKHQSYTVKQVVETSEVRSVETFVPTLQPTTAHSFTLRESEPNEQSATLTTPTDTKILVAFSAKTRYDAINHSLRDADVASQKGDSITAQDNITGTRAALQRASYEISLDSDQESASNSAALNPGASMRAAEQSSGEKISDNLKPSTSSHDVVLESHSLGDDESPVPQARIASLNSYELSDLQQPGALTARGAEGDAVSVSSESLECSRINRTETEEMVEMEVEETVTMVITGVVSNPGELDEIVVSLHDSVQRGILDMSSGIYHNATTGEDISMVEAMNSGLVKREFI